MKKVNLLIICTQNSARSQMAEAFFKKYGGDVVDVYSAGFDPAVVNVNAVTAMQEIGIDISGHHSKSVKEFLGKMSFGYVIAVCKKVEEKCPVIFPGAHTILSWPFDDPAVSEGTLAEQLQKFCQVRDEIEAKVKEWLIEYRAHLAEEQINH